MTNGVPKSTPQEDTEPAGVPLGGIGAGCVEMGADGRFRNITINNNRNPDERIPLSEASFVAIRIKAGQSVYTRVLQREEKGHPGPGGKETPALPKDSYAWRGLYPASDYRLVDYDCAAEILWSAFAPVVPFDYDASTLPAFFLGVQIHNPTDEPLEVSVLFNWENLCGHTATNTPKQCAPIFPKHVDIEREYLRLDLNEEFEKPPPPPPNALLFGPPQEITNNADGQYCLAVRPDEATEISVFPWDHQNEQDKQNFWDAFRFEGSLLGLRGTSNSQRSGAVCATFQLRPKEKKRADFVLSWYCPRYKVNGKNIGNGYTNRFQDATEVTLNGIDHLDYYYSAVKDWHRRVHSSSLPKWLNEMLINSNYIFSTNTIHTKDGLFGMMESPQNGTICDWPSRLYSSLGTLLFFPRLEKDELAQTAKATNPKSPEQLAQNLGHLTLENPSFQNAPEYQVNLWAQRALTIYRNLILTGDTIAAQEVFPHIRNTVLPILARDADRDGLPERGNDIPYDGITVPGLTSYTASLWVVALRAYGHLARHLGHKEEGKRFDLIHKRAKESFETRYWDGELGYYRFYVQSDQHQTTQTPAPPQEACHLGQLAGQWYADFLGFGPLFHTAHMTRALKTILRNNTKKYSLADLTTPTQNDQSDLSQNAGSPGLTAGHFASLLISRGLIQEGLAILDAQVKAIHQRSKNTFNQPKRWNLSDNEVPPNTLERHSAALSAWYALYALQGFLLDVPNDRLRIMPQRSQQATKFTTPIFTPNCLGMLSFREERADQYRQRIAVTFDSPVSIKTIELSIPLNVKNISLQCRTTTSDVQTECTLKTEKNYQQLLITPRHPITASGEFRIDVTEATIVEEKITPKKGWWR